MRVVFISGSLVYSKKELLDLLGIHEDDLEKLRILENSIKYFSIDFKKEIPIETLKLLGLLF